MNLSPKSDDANLGKSPDTYRFRVDRINSIVTGHHKDTAIPVQTIKEEEGEETVAYITSYPLETIQGSPASSGGDSDYSDIRGGSGGARGRSNSKLNLIGSEVDRKNWNRRQSAQRELNVMSNNGPPPVVRKFSLAGILGRRKSSNLPDIEDFQNSNGTVGVYGKSLHQYTHDALPKMENYRNLMSFHAGQRPTIDELHEPKFRSPQSQKVSCYSSH